MLHLKSIVPMLLLMACMFSAEGKNKYTIATVNWAGWSFLDVAEVKGYWSDLGVDVEILRFNDGAIMHDRMLTGEVDFSMNMMPYSVWMNQNVKPVSVLMETNWSDGGDKLILRSPEEFFSDGGKKVIGVYLMGYSLEYFIHSYLKSKGLKLSDYTLVKMLPSDLVKQFNIGRLDAVAIFEPLASKITQTGKGIIVTTTADYPGVIREGLYTFHDRLITYPKEDVIKILRGIIRGMEWIDATDNRSEYYTILNEKTFFNESFNFSPEQLERMLSEVRIHTLTTMNQYNFDQLGNYFKDLFVFLNEQNWLDSADGSENMLYLSYLKEAIRLELKQ